MIPVTKPFLPPEEEYAKLLNGVWERNWLTNNGPLVNELESKLKDFLNVKHLLYVANGTIALQLALKSLKLEGGIITTPFSYVATTSSILWENCKPVFVDINSSNFCIDATKIEDAITPNTKAILATHVFGHPCDVLAIDEIAKKHKLKVIYDAAHAFGTQLHGKSILDFGDISTCSFHATKLFHTIEGGCTITKDANIASKLNLKRQFGHVGDDHLTVGVNGKNSEFHAAMGLCNLRYINKILERRKEQWLFYQKTLEAFGNIQLLTISKDITYNYAYFPIVLSSEQQLLQLIMALKTKEVVPRRYFYPSLNTLPYILDFYPCPIAESTAKRVICLPLYHQLDQNEQSMIIDVINNELNNKN